ncbi:MAG: hypothetical protein ACRCZ2_01115 [Fusobacteriaceae bacterium]
MFKNLFKKLFGKDSEYVNVKLNKEIHVILKEWNVKRKDDISLKKNLGTREAIYKIQSRTYMPTHPDYGFEEVELCLDFCGDPNYFKNLEEIKQHYNSSDFFNSIAEFEEFMELIEESSNIHDFLSKFEETDIEYDEAYIIHFKEVWKDQAYFLTRDEAEAYTKYQAHNLRYSRVYVEYPGYGNRSYFNKFLEILDHKDIFGGGVDNR